MIIAIDGPAGSGKSTVSRRLAARLGAMYLDSGAMYRTLALACLKNEIDTSDEGAVVSLFESVEINQIMDDGVQQVFLNSEDVSEAVRSPQVTGAVPPIAAMPLVRKRMRALQRAFGERAGDERLVAEGRDMTTVVFADADIKFYLDAGSRVRAERRHKELLGRGIDVDIEELARDIEARDRSDICREVAPLKIGDDAIRIDTSEMGIDEVVDRLYDEIQSARKR